MNDIDAFHLPGLPESEITEFRRAEYPDGVVLRFPVLDGDALGRVTGHLRGRAPWLADRPAAEIVAAVDAAAGRLMDPAGPYRPIAERALPAITAYSAPMIRLVLDRMAADWRAGALEDLLRAELGDPALLDGFRPAPDRGPGTRVRAFGPELAFHVFAGNVAGVAVTSLVRSLLVKAATLGKTASGEPLLPALFARALADVSPALGECVAVTYWPGGTPELEAVALDAAELAVVYGGRETVSDLRRRLPVGTRLVVHGPRLSFGLVGRDALADAATARRTADAVARATAVFDQQGCVSPHLVYVERGGSITPEDFAALVARGLDALGTELPRGRLTPAEAARIRHLRDATEFRAASVAGVLVLAPEGADYAVIYDPEPAFDTSCLNRVLHVRPVDELEDALAHVRPYAAHLQTAAIAGAGRRLEPLARELGRIGVSRVTTFDRMPWPAPAWHHDGAEPIRELVRWVDLEAPEEG